MPATMRRRWALAALATILTLPGCGALGQLTTGSSGTAGGSASTAAGTGGTTTVVTIPAATTPTVPSTTTTAKPKPVPANLPAGWRAFSGDDVAVAAPAGWRDVKRVLQNPAVKDQVDQQAQDLLGGGAGNGVNAALANMDLLLMSPTTSAASVTQLSAYLEPGGGIVSFTDLEQELKADVKRAKGVTVTTKRTTVAGRPTLTVDLSLTTGGVKVVEREYLWAAGDDLIIVTFATRGKPDYALWSKMVATAGVGVAA